MTKKLRKFEKIAFYKGKSWSVDDEMKSKKKKKNNININRILISINIVGSSGPLKIVVNKNDIVCDVIDKALKFYASQGRLPALKSDVSDYVLHCSNGVLDGAALNPSEPIGSFKTRKFLLSENQASSTKTEEKAGSKRRNCSWKSFSFKKFRFALHCATIS
ncbi:unnamed protein product [Lathyrus sativus]|nr:unnamed protein product [Lathyrus sativus]